MPDLAIRPSEVATPAPRPDLKPLTPNPADTRRARQAMDHLSLSWARPAVADPREDLDHLSLTASDHHQADPDERWM